MARDEIDERGVVTGSLAGRSAEATLLEEALLRARSGHPQVVVVEGSAGIGKTALVDQFVGTCPDDVVVLRARCDEAESDLSLGVVAQLFAGTALTGGGFNAPGVDLDPLAAGAQLLAALDELQGNVVSVALVIDDAHLSDVLSSGALMFTARRLLSDRVLMVLTARTGLLDRGWERQIADGLGRRIVLQGLGPTELTELAASMGVRLSPDSARRLWQDTDGHPLYARTLLLTDPDSVTTGLASAGPVAPPPALAELVVATLERCAPETRRLLAAAAVLGRRCNLGDAVALAEVEDPVGAFEEAAATGILAQPVQPALELRFAHALVHGAVYQHLGLAAQVRLHRQAIGLSTGRRQLAHRVAATAGTDERLAADLEVLAHQEQHAGALLAAGEHLRQAAEVSPAGPAADRRLLEAVETWLISGEATRALALEERARAATGPYRDHVVGYLALVSGRLPQAQEAFRRAWDAVQHGEDEGAPPDLAGRIAVCMAILTVIDLNVDEMLAWGEAAQRETAGDDQAVSFAWFCRVLPLATLGRGHEALALLSGSGIPQTADVLAARGVVECWTDDLTAAREHLLAAFTRSRGGEPMRVTQAIGFLAEVEYRLGRFDESAVHSELAVEAAIDAGRLWDLPLLHALAAYPHAALGDLERADHHAGIASQLAEMIPIAAFQAYAAGARVAVALSRRDFEALLEGATAIQAVYSQVDPGTATYGPVLAEALVELDWLEQADKALAEFEARASACARRSALLGAARVRGLLAARRGEEAEAVAAFEAGTMLANGLTLPLEAARLEEAWGRSLIRLGHPGTALVHLELAESAYHRIGATAHAAGVHAALAALGETSSAPTPDRRLAELSASEAMVARLVADGLSNRQIAEQLVVSVKAVEYHLTNIYRRLGVSSRVKLARLVEGLGDQ